MNELEIFNNPEFGQIRATEINGEPYFVGKDVCDAFGDTNYRRSLSKIDDSDKGVSQIATPGGKQTMTVINESGLYSLLFQMQPQKGNENEAIVNARIDKLHHFKHWVTSEVLPTIRKHGAYATPATIESIIANPDNGIRLLQALKEEQEKRKALEAQNAEMKPKALFAEAVSASKSSILIGDLAKIIKQNGHEIGQKRLFCWLRDNGWLIKQKGASWNMPTQRSMEMGLFEIKESTFQNPDGSVRITKTPKVTGRGQVFFINKFCGGSTDAEEN